MSACAKLWFVSLAVFLPLLFLPGGVCAQARLASTHTNPALPTLWIVGNGGGPDTMLQSPEPNSSFATLLEPARINLVDKTDRSSSSRGYIIHGRWAQILPQIRPGDFVLIQFAHRPAAPDASLPGISDDMREIDDPAHPPREIVHTYGWYLREFAVESIARGATPILCTPASEPTASGEDATWTRAIALQQRVPLVDVAAILTGAGAGSAGSPETAATALVSCLKGLTGNPLAGYFSAAAAKIPAYRPAPQATPLNSKD